MDIGVIHCQHQDTIPVLSRKYPFHVEFARDFQHYDRVNLVKWFVRELQYDTCLCFVDLNLLLEVRHKVGAAHLAAQAVHPEQAVLGPVKHVQEQVCRIWIFLLGGPPPLQAHKRAGGGAMDR